MRTLAASSGGRGGEATGGDAPSRGRWARTPCRLCFLSVHACHLRSAHADKTLWAVPKRASMEASSNILLKTLTLVFSEPGSLSV